MRLYYDGTSNTEISELFDLGVISGVTTNLSFCKKAMNENSIEYQDLLTSIHQNVSNKKNDFSLSMQVSATEPNLMIDEAIMFQSKFSKGVDLKVKIPLNYSNYGVVNSLIKKNISVNATCVTGFMQAIVAANMGCRYISFFWGKMTDEDIDPYKMVSEFRNLLDKNNLNKTSNILVGSIRQPQVISEAFKAGADIVTTQFQNFPKFLNQLKSNEANELFQKDWNS